MTEENTMTEFGTHTGRVNRFFNRKGYGFIHDLDEDKDHEKIVNEFINKEAPEGIEVAEFEGLNINEEMG